MSLFLGTVFKFKENIDIEDIEKCRKVFICIEKNLVIDDSKLL